MHLRRFNAKSVSEALMKVKAELGADAIILSTKNRSMTEASTGNVVQYVEVVAAVDKEPEKGGSKTVRRAPRVFESRKKGVSGSEEKLLKEIDVLKDELRQIHEAIRLLQPSLSSGSHHDDEMAEKRRRVAESISSCLGLDRKGEAYIRRLLDRIGDSQYESLPGLLVHLRSFISSSLKLGALAETSNRRCWWAFVGPTGVGKTTTLAKIAARLKFLSKRRGVLICVDGYRMGAREQLEKYANLMAIPIETARTNKDLVRLFGKHSQKDFIFVDTTGRNPFSSCHKTELERLFDSVPGLMAQVMLSATSKREDLMGAISFYRQFPVAGWTLTKTDETTSLASSLFPLIEAEVPLSYVTNGQRVPEDISHVEGRRLADIALEPLKGLERLLDVQRYEKREMKTAAPETI